jgi:signal transduction histidine kinase
LTAEKTGAGLGLSIARQLARGLGGDLRFASREGTGAEFILELPHES